MAIRLEEIQDKVVTHKFIIITMINRLTSVHNKEKISDQILQEMEMAVIMVTTEEEGVLSTTTLTTLATQILITIIMTTGRTNLTLTTITIITILPMADSNNKIDITTIKEDQTDKVVFFLQISTITITTRV
jgi:hypothetical protein